MAEILWNEDGHAFIRVSDISMCVLKRRTKLERSDSKYVIEIYPRGALARSSGTFTFEAGSYKTLEEAEARLKKISEEVEAWS